MLTNNTLDFPRPLKILSLDPFPPDDAALLAVTGSVAVAAGRCWGEGTEGG